MFYNSLSIRKSHIQIFAVSCFLLLFSTSCVTLYTNYEIVDTDVLMHPRLIWTDNPQTRAVICWDTEAEGSDLAW